MRGTEDNNSNRSGGATNVGKDVGEEEELPDSREDDPMLVAEDAQLQGKCPALLRQFKGQLPAVIQYTMELKRNKPQLTTENTEALHTWQLLEEMMEAILKLAKDIDAALATCFVKLQDLHRRVVHDLYHPDVLKMKTPEAIARIIRQCKPKIDKFKEAVRTFKNLKPLICTQKDLKKALWNVGADWAKKTMECKEKLPEIISNMRQTLQDRREKQTDELMRLIRIKENLNLEEKAQKLRFLVKMSRMAEKKEREFQELYCKAWWDYAQESETKTHYYTTGWWLWTIIHKEMVENPLKEEKRRNKDYLKNEAEKFERKHEKINEEIADVRSELYAAQREARQIDKCIEDLVYQMEKESEILESEVDEAIKYAEKEYEYLARVKEILGVDAGLVNILEAIDRFQLLSRQGDSVHALLCRMLENISIRYSNWIEAMENLAEDPRDDEYLDEVRIAREYIAHPNIPHPNPFLDMETEPENAGKKLLEF